MKFFNINGISIDRWAGFVESYAKKTDIVPD